MIMLVSRASPFAPRGWPARLDYVLYYTDLYYRHYYTVCSKSSVSQICFKDVRLPSICQEIDTNFLKSTNLATKDRHTSPEDDKLLFFQLLYTMKENLIS